MSVSALMSRCQGNRLGWCQNTDPPFMLLKSANIALVMSAADMTRTLESILSVSFAAPREGSFQVRVVL